MKKIWLICFLTSCCCSVSFSQAAENEIYLEELKQLFSRGETHLNNRQFDSATVVLKAAFDFAKQNLSQDHVLTADIAHALGYAMMVQQQPAAAMPYYLEALRIRQMFHTSPDATLAFTHNGLGLLYESAGESRQAETHFIEARTQWAGSLGKDHLRYGWAQHNLGRLYNKTGRHEEAVACLTDALRVKQLNLPPDDPDLGHSLVPLSSSLFELGDFTAYEACAMRAIEIWKKQKGTNDLLYYWSLHNRANLQENLGNHDMAKSLAYEAVRGKSTIRGDQHVDVALSLITLATIFSAEGQPDSSHSYLMKAGAIYAQQAPHSMEYAWVLSKLGLHALSQRHFDQALSFLTASLDLKKTLIGTESTEYSTTLLQVIRVLIQLNQFDTAHLLLQQQKLFYEKHDITRHANYLVCLDLLGHVQIALEDKLAALQTYQLANRINRETASLVSGIASEREFFRFVKSAEYYLDKYLSLALSSRAIPESIAMDVSNHIFWNRSFLLDKYTATRNQVEWDTGSLRLYNEVAFLRKKLYAQQTRLPSARLDTKEIEEKIISLENDIAERVPFLSQPVATTASIRHILKRGEIAIEFFDYTYHMPEYRDSVFYGAMVIFPGTVDPVLLPLFEARQLMRFVADTLSGRTDIANLIYTEYGLEVYNLIWKPLLPYLSNVRTIYFSTSGLLHRINFHALPVNQARILADEYDLVRVVTIGQLVITEHPVSPTTECALMGDIYYTSDATGGEQHDNPQDAMAQAMYGVTKMPGSDTSQRGDSWQYLKGSGEEIDHIARIMQQAGFTIHSWKENEATEEQFKQLSRTKMRRQSPRVIHISTHGYFFPDPVRQANEAWPNVRGHLIESADNPMIRSGLILAGGNYAWTHGEPLQPWMEDGILTASEISTLDLSDTELVVLSACETGLGDIEGNEGVYGLQRALKIAGVQYLIMSLWQVPDAATAELMQRFYNHWLIGKKSLRESLRRTQQEMRQEGFDPYEWAGFILIE